MDEVKVKDVFIRRRLWAAASVGNLTAVMDALDEGADVNSIDESGFSPLLLAEIGGHEETANELLRRGADVSSIAPRTKLTALHYAGMKCSREHVETLIDLGADVGAKAKAGGKTGRAYGVTTPLSCAIGFGNDEAAEAIWKEVSAKGMVGEESEAFVEAVGRVGGFSWAKRIFEVAPELIETRGSIGESMLHWASEGDVESVEMLLVAGMNPSLCDMLGRTASHWGASAGRASVLERLLRSSSAEIRDESGRTPMHCAASSGGGVESKDCLAVLLNAGHGIDARSNVGETPLHEAVDAEDLEAVRFLVERGAALDIESNQGVTPLRLAVCGGRSEDGVPEAVEVLAKAGAKGFGSWLDVEGLTTTGAAAWRRHELSEKLEDSVDKISNRSRGTKV